MWHCYCHLQNELSSWLCTLIAHHFIRYCFFNFSLKDVLESFRSVSLISFERIFILFEAAFFSTLNLLFSLPPIVCWEETPKTACGNVPFKIHFYKKSYKVLNCMSLLINAISKSPYQCSTGRQYYIVIIEGVYNYPDLYHLQGVWVYLFSMSSQEWLFDIKGVNHYVYAVLTYFERNEHDCRIKWIFQCYLQNILNCKNFLWWCSKVEWWFDCRFN